MPKSVLACVSMRNCVYVFGEKTWELQRRMCVFMKLALSSSDFLRIGDWAGWGGNSFLSQLSQRQDDLYCKYRQQNSGQIQDSYFLILWMISVRSPLCSHKTYPETVQTVSEWVALRSHLTVREPWISWEETNNKMICSQDDTAIVFSLCLSHYCCVSLFNLGQEDKVLNVTESTCQAAGADVLIYKKLHKDNDIKWNYFQLSSG